MGDTFEARKREPEVGMSRRGFLGLAASAALAETSSPAAAADELTPALAKLKYLTPDREFIPVERGDPLPYKLPETKLREIGMTGETWKLDVVPENGARVENPMSRERGN